MIRCFLDTPPEYLEERPVSHAETVRKYVVAGMTCDHCVLSVSEEVSEVAGVEQVDVELVSGRLVVRGERVSDDAVRAAVADAGYEVIG
jgi:copper chaperone